MANLRVFCLLSALLSGAVPGGLVRASTTTAKLVCNLHALTRDERAAHAELGRRLLAAILERRELGAGFALRIDSKKVSITDLGVWMDAERRCCPFLGLEVAKEPFEGPLWLRLTGPEGAKDFLMAEMGG